MNEPNPSLEEFLFEAALEKSSVAERATFLDGVCRGNPVLRARLDVLLEGHFQAESFLAAGPGKAKAKPTSPPAEDEAASTFIGRYKLLEKLGEGGFGDVWMAEQKEPVRRRVALKIIKLGMDTKQVIARFEAERQALALMDHPNIAKVFDGGATDTGRPYFVMELVRGVRITEYCDQNQLSIQERLRLFTQVCRAVQHAHQKGVIHRDLKPSNILVTLQDGAPVPKIIDFGIAKATQQELTDKTVFTQFRLFLGTPAYVSPEQAEMTSADIDTRSDIYSLGVLLYELLTGTTPFDTQELIKAGLEGMRQIIRERPPPRPSTRLSRRPVASGADSSAESKIENQKSKIAIDLDWIVMKCLEKDRARRYETANGLARDIERHLNNEPVVARPPSRLYEFQKTMRRHWVGFAAVAAVLLVLAIGAVVSALLAVRARQATQRERKAVYASKMNLAQAAWEQNRIAQLRKLLEETAGYPDRGFEWYYWQRLAHLEIKTLYGHLDEVNAVAFSPDGRRIITSGEDMTVRVWDAASGTELLTLKGHLHGVYVVASSPDGRRIATGSIDGTAKVWDAATGERLLSLEEHGGRIQSVDFSPDGGRLLTSSTDGTARVWDAATGKGLLTVSGHTGRILDAAFSPDGRRIITSGDDRTARMWDALTGQPLLIFQGHGDAVWCVAFSPDGRRIVTGSDQRDPTARVWDADSGKELLILAGHGGAINSVRFSRDNQRIITASNDRTVKVWEAATGKELFTLKGHTDVVNDAAFSPDGRQIATAGSDHAVKIWDAAGDREVLTLKGHTNELLDVAFSCDGGRVVTASGDRTAKVWDAATGKLLVTLQGRHSRPVRGAAFSPDGQRIVTASGDQSAIVWEVATGRDLFTLQGHSAPVIRALFSPDGRRIVTASADATAKIWEADGGSYVRTLQGHDSGIFGLAFSPDGGRIATGSADQTVRVWDATSGRTLLTLTGLSGIVASVAFSPDGGRIAAASTAGPWTTPATATLWDARSGKLLRTFKGHSAEVDSVAFSPDGRRLLTGSGDETARVWDAATGEELLTLKCHNWAAFSPDGRRIVTACADWTAKVWEAATPSQLTAWQADENEASRRLDALAREQQAVINRARAASANDPGAIKQWLILGPIGFNGHCGSVGVNQEQLAGEAHLRPSAGERIHVGESDLAWRPLQLHDYFIDFHPLFLAGPNWSVTYAVCYIESESDQTGLTIKVSSEDQSKIYLNGNEIYRCERARQYLPDQDEVSGVELKRGLNTLVFKVANEEDTPQASLRFTDAAGRPLKGIRTTLTPR